MKCADCFTDMYCIDSRGLRHPNSSGVGSNRRKNNYDYQMKQRWYVCPNETCNNRFTSIEVLNPVAYVKRAMPKSKRKILVGG